MPRKSNTRRDDGRIKVQVYVGTDPSTGKKKYKYAYGLTQKEADQKADEIRLALRKGLDVSSELITFGQWARRWLAIKTPEVSAAKGVVYSSHVKHLIKELERMDIQKVRTADIQGIVSALAERNPNTGRPTSRETLSGLKSTANQIFQFAIDNRALDYNPVPSVRLLAKESPPKVRALTTEEQQWIVNTPHHSQLAAMIMMYGGLRRGELIALTWNDVDLWEKTITVTKSVEMVKGQMVLKGFAKTPSSIRTVYIPDRLVEFLKLQPHRGIYVCTAADGGMHTASSWRRMWESYLHDLNLKYGEFGVFDKQPKSKFDPKGVPFIIPKINPHWLRHTFCTMLYFAGVDILTAKNQMGHADIKTTLEIYTHLDALHKSKEICKLNEYLNDENLTGNKNQMKVR